MLRGCCGLERIEFDVGLTALNGQVHSSVRHEKSMAMTYPLLLPLTLCSLNVMSLTPSSQPPSRSQPRRSSSVVHQFNSEIIRAVVAPGSTGPSSSVFLLDPCWVDCSCALS